MTPMIQFKYAVVQFHRNPVRGEPFNIGLLMVSSQHPPLVKFEPNIKSALKLDPVEYRAIDACLREIRDAVQTAPSDPAFLTRFAASYIGKIQLTEARGGVSADVAAEAESLFQTFVAHPRLRRSRASRKGAANDLKLLLQENKLIGRHKVSRHYTISLNAEDQVKMDFGYVFGSGHVAIEAVDLTLPEREDRLEEVGPAAGKFQFLGEKLKSSVTRYAAVKTNGVDAAWELEHITGASDAVFNIESDSAKLIGQIEAHLATNQGRPSQLAR